MTLNCLLRTAKRLLTEIVEKGRPAPAFNHNDGPGMTVQEIMVPASKAGLVIGKGGETIKSLQERAGVKMVMIQDGPQNTGADKPLRISGEPFKVQVGPQPHHSSSALITRVLWLHNTSVCLHGDQCCDETLSSLHSKPKRW